MLTIRINVHSLSRQSNTFNHLKFQIPSFHLACLADRAGQGRAAVQEFQRSGAIIFIIFITFITFIILSCTGHAPEQWRAHTQRLMLQWSGWLGAPGPAIARLPRLRGALINIFLVWLVPVPGAGACWCWCWGLVSGVCQYVPAPVQASLYIVLLATYYICPLSRSSKR